jgi:hypothetical protein
VGFHVQGALGFSGLFGAAPLNFAELGREGFELFRFARLHSFVEGHGPKFTDGDMNPEQRCSDMVPRCQEVNTSFA